MAFLAFQKPEKEIMLEVDNFQGNFEFGRLEPGYVITFGIAWRGLLFWSFEGFAIIVIHIEGLVHDFD